MLERKLRDALEWDKQSKLPFHMGHFPYSPKTFENLETKAMVQKFPGKDSRNSGKCWISEMRTIQPKILEILGAKLNGKKTSGETFSKIWVLLARFSSFLEILENALFLSLLLRIQTKRFGWMESAPRCTCTHGCFVPWLTAKGLLTRTNAI